MPEGSRIARSAESTPNGKVTGGNSCTSLKPSPPALRQNKGQSSPSMMDALPPELDRLCIVPSGSSSARTAKTTAPLGATTSTGSLSDRTAKVTPTQDDSTGYDADEDAAWMNGLAQIDELDKLLERQVECERFARFDRLLHACENALPLSEKEMGDLEALKSHVALADPSIGNSLFRTQAETVSTTPSASADLVEGSEVDDSTPRTHSAASGDAPGETKQRVPRPDGKDVPNFIQRNIDTVVNDGNLTRLTVEEQARLAELLADDSGDEDELEKNIVGSIESVTATGDEVLDDDGSSSQLALATVASDKDVVVSQILSRQRPKHPYRLSRNQRQRVEEIDRALQHLSLNALPSSSSPELLCSSSLASIGSLQAQDAEQGTSRSLVSLPPSGLLDAASLPADGDVSPEALSREQLDLLLEQCRREQAEQPMAKLSEAVQPKMMSGVSDDQLAISMGDTDEAEGVDDSYDNDDSGLADYDEHGETGLETATQW